MFLSILAALWIVGLAVLSARVYGHRGRGYAAGKGEIIPTARSFRWVYSYLQVSTLAAGIGALLMKSPVFLVVHSSPVATAAGLLTATLGMGLFVKARRILGRQYSPCYDAYVPFQVITAGPYHVIRHPIYTANLIVLLGLFVATGSLWVAFNFALLGVYYFRSARAEERALSARFAEYGRYMQHTHMLIPGVL